MAYTFTNSRGQTYTLHRKDVALKSGQQRVLHYFSRSAGEFAIDQIPDGYVVVEARTGLPLLKRS